ncbi:hypothetical protein PRK78_001547 [Emydomyces testavorans]|uniref:Uncharacterized protein n=1 Tax=Emydomyces testavorans TaxID=2070801 RepID=A0AAF0IGS7_9EURO|nr:hypothetical protein PRK78_001547 [Emydomyces testavorans]
MEIPRGTSSSKEKDDVFGDVETTGFRLERIGGQSANEHEIEQRRAEIEKLAVDVSILEESSSAGKT